MKGFLEGGGGLVSVGLQKRPSQLLLFGFACVRQIGEGSEVGTEGGKDGRPDGAEESSGRGEQAGDARSFSHEESYGESNERAPILFVISRNLAG